MAIWLHYDQAENRMFCHTVVEACIKGMALPGGRKKDAFVTVVFFLCLHSSCSVMYCLFITKIRDYCAFFSLFLFSMYMYIFMSVVFFQRFHIMV